MENPKRSAEEDRQSHLDGYEKDAASWRRRLSELEAIGLVEGDPAWDEAKRGVENALAALEALGGKGQRNAEKRPAKAAAKR